MRIAVLALKNKKLLRELRHRLFKAIDKTERAICVFNKKKKTESHVLEIFVMRWQKNHLKLPRSFLNESGKFKILQNLSLFISHSPHNYF